MQLGPVTGTDSSGSGELVGCRVVVTRARPGELGRMLSERGAEVVHVPLIAVTEPPDGGVGLERELGRLDRYSWLVVTSPSGAERVGHAAARHSDVRLAAVGAATAQRLAALAGRHVEVVPQRQLAAELADELLDRCTEPTTFLLALADRAGTTLADRLTAGGHDVTVVDAYSTVLVEPDRAAIGHAAIDDADVLVLASGSAADGWVDAFGAHRPPIVVAIGPSTAEHARQIGLKVDGVAADHSLEGLVDEVIHQVVRLRARNRK